MIRMENAHSSLFDQLSQTGFYPGLHTHEECKKWQKDGCNICLGQTIDRLPGISAIFWTNVLRNSGVYINRNIAQHTKLRD